MHATQEGYIFSPDNLLDMQKAPPLRFAIFWAGALIRDRNLSFIYKTNMTLPSIHIIGDRDYVKEVLHSASSLLHSSDSVPCMECCAPAPLTHPSLSA